MKPNELRLGNKINMPFLGDTILDVVGIALNSENKTFIQSENGNDTFFELPEKYQPIPLTEEWLVKFGFKPLVKDWQIKGLILHTRKRGFVVNKKIPIVKYVHQLQNLYFALTGEELTLNSIP